MNKGHGPLNFFRHPVIGGRTNRKNGAAKGGAIVFRKEEGSCQVSVPDPVLNWHDGSVTLRIGQRKMSVNQFRDTRRHVTANARRFLSQTLKAIRRDHGPYTLTVVINCGGGATAVCKGYAQALRRWRGKKRCVIDGDCSSAATLIAFLPKWEISVTPKSSMLIHHAKTLRFKKSTKRTYKNGVLVSEMVHWHELLSGSEAANRTTDRDFERLYHRRTGKPPQLIREWMDAGKRFRASEMYAFGFADEMKPYTKE